MLLEEQARVPRDVEELGGRKDTTPDSDRRDAAAAAKHISKYQMWIDAFGADGDPMEEGRHLADEDTDTGRAGHLLEVTRNRAEAQRGVEPGICGLPGGHACPPLRLPIHSHVSARFAGAYLSLSGR